MKALLFATLTLLTTILGVSALDSPKGFETASINIGYMSQQELGERVPVTELAAYIKRLQAICTESFAQTVTPEDLDIIVAVKPGNHTRVWFVSSRTPAANEKSDELRKKLETVASPKVTGGPIAFCINGRIAGGSGKAPKEAGAPPTPKEWQDALSKQKEPLLFDALLPLIWPE